MKKLQILLAALLCCTMGVNAQIKLMSNGKIGLGTTNPQYWMDFRLGSGALRLDAWTDIFIDQTGSCGSPIIYPEKDWYLQLGKQDKKIGTIYVETIHVWDFHNYSDSTVKCDFKRINKEQNKFRQLKSYKYHFTKEHLKTLPDSEQKKYEPGRFGFKAQDIIDIYPELVYKENEDGLYSVNYIGFIPILVEMVQDLQDLTAAQSTKIKELQKQVDELADANNDGNGNNKGKGNDNGNGPRKNKVKSVKPTNVETEVAYANDDESRELIDVATNAFLFQNTPNPFSNTTEIKYYVPENADNAVLYVFSLQGNMLLTKPVSQLGNGSITISASELQPGMYIYTLAVDGQEADSKRMIITEE